MTFWSSQRLVGQLPNIVDHTDLGAVDCNAITLCIGGEIYITPGVENIEPNSHTKKTLAAGEAFTIPPGRFAFLITQEKITIPQDAMGFISFKARYKMKGLVNVSGFHVDPGYSGQLIFSVFNAGPAPVHLQQGWPLFLLWIAELDAPSAERKTTPAKDGINPDVINSITGTLDSIHDVEKRIADKLKKLADEDKSLNNRIHEMEKKQQKVLIGLGIATAVLSMLAGGFIKELIWPHDKQVISAASIDNRTPPNVPTTTPVAPNSLTPADISPKKEEKSLTALTGNR